MSNFACFLSSVDFFSKSTFFKVRSFDPDQAQHFVGPDLGPNCLQMLSADDTSRGKELNMIFLFVCSV